jgi:uncharacterized membrane protein YfcA
VAEDAIAFVLAAAVGVTVGGLLFLWTDGFHYAMVLPSLIVATGAYLVLRHGPVSR